jgi:hypothetical protein
LKRRLKMVNGSPHLRTRTIKDVVHKVVKTKTLITGMAVVIILTNRFRRIHLTTGPPIPEAPEAVAEEVVVLVVAVEEETHAVEDEAAGAVLLAVVALVVIVLLMIINKRTMMVDMTTTTAMEILVVCNL